MLYVNFNAYASYVTDSLYQWDINQDLVINGLGLSAAPEIHFTNSNMERAIVRQSTINNGVITVRIPNSLLQEALTIKAYVGVYEGETFKVIETVEIPVIAKSRPSDYSMTDADEEIYSFNALENMIAVTNDKYNAILNNVDTHSKRQDNPHGVTYDQVGAAPAGHGLGTGAVTFYIPNIDNMKNNGWYCGSTANGYRVGNAITYYILLKVDSWKNLIGKDRVCQTIYPDSNVLSHAQRWWIDNAWTEWEWENPPLTLGVEYRTSERFMGKPVYIKAIDFGELPNNSEKRVALGVTDVTLIQTYGPIYGKGNASLEVSKNLEIYCDGSYRVVIVTTSDYTGYYARVIVKYVKN